MLQTAASFVLFGVRPFKQKKAPSVLNLTLVCCFEYLDLKIVYLYGYFSGFDRIFEVFCAVMSADSVCQDPWPSSKHFNISMLSQRSNSDATQGP